MRAYLEFSKREKELLAERKMFVSTDGFYELDLLEEWEIIIEEWMDEYVHDFEKDEIPTKTLEIEKLFNHINEFLRETDD